MRPLAYIHTQITCTGLRPVGRGPPGGSDSRDGLDDGGLVGLHAGAGAGAAGDQGAGGIVGVAVGGGGVLDPELEVGEVGGRDGYEGTRRRSAC